MNEFNINLVGKEENIKKEEILNNFDINYLPINNLPISYFPLNNPVLSNELNDKDIDTISEIRTNDFSPDYNDLRYIDINASTGMNIESITNNPNYKLLVYRNNGTLKIDGNITCDILIVGGGGGAGYDGGGGGGGGQVLYYTNDSPSFKSGNSITLNTGTYNINIGNGGIGSTTSGSIGSEQAKSINGTNGLLSSIVNASTSTTIVSAKGGGGGGSRNNLGNGGDVGGSGGNGHANSGASQISSNNGGSGGTNSGTSTGGGGGGGGANTTGTSKNGENNQASRAGNGGSGVDINISGISVGYGGGGGGGSWSYVGGIATHGGGSGNITNNNGNPQAGIANTGGGGGGGGNASTGNPSGMNGGSGIVIIRIKYNELNIINKTLTFIEPNNNIRITKDINVDLLLVGGGGGGGGKNIDITGTNNTINKVTNNPDYSYAFFANSGSFVIDNNITCDILVVGGGGGGGFGGGGGAGAILFATNYTIPSGTHTIIVGTGGAGAPRNTNGTNGNNSSITISGTSYIAIGGGGGGYRIESGNPLFGRPGNNGGSGGGGGHSDGVTTPQNNLGGTSTKIIYSDDWTSYGNSGGNGKNGDYEATGYGSGGGGGSGSIGTNADNNSGGNGGTGINMNSYFGSVVGNNGWFGGGGGGGSYSGRAGYINGYGNGGSGNYGGGGNAFSVNGLANTGGGGGGADYNNISGNGGTGGSGVVIIRFKTKYLYSGGGGGGEVKYLKDYKLKKGFYNINIGLGGNVKNNGGISYIMKNNTNLIEAKGGNKGNGFILDNDKNNYLGGASHKNNLGKGADGNILNDNAQSGELIKIENIKKYYGNGGLKENTTTKFLNIDNNFYSDDGRGGKGNLNNDNGKGKNGIVILKYKNNDIEFIKRYITDTTDLIYKSSIDLLSRGISIEPTDNNPNYKLVVYRSGISNTLILNKDITCDILIVGGGGSGANNCVGWEGGGGGGAGAVGIGNNITLNAGTYNIAIGIGGVAKTIHGDGYNGSNTTINNNTNFNEIANGGGYGSLGDGGLGGSGGGASGSGDNRAEGIANKGTGKLTYYGNNGGYGFNQSGGSGGGGAGSKGISTLRKQNFNGGNGGYGITSSISGTPIYYGGGGGGSANAFRTDITHGIGGSGSGGNGGYFNNATSGIANTGGGGGGANSKNINLHSDISCNTNSSSGAGGSGIVIFRVKREDIESGLSKDDLYKKIDKDTRIINDIKDEFKKKLKGFENNNMPYNKFSIFPLVILIILIWLFIFLFLLKFVHHYFVNIYLYILLSIIIFLLIFGSMWFLYSNNDL